MTERRIMQDIRKAVNLDGRCRLVRNPVGFDSVTNTHFGIGVGSADLVGVVIGPGRLFALEVKTPIGRLRPEQRAWLAAARKVGGFAAVVRSVSEAMAAVERACRGASE